MIRRTVSAMSSSALVAAGFIASGVAPAGAGVANRTGEIRATVALTRAQAISRAEAVTGARAIDVSHAGGRPQEPSSEPDGTQPCGQGLYGIELVRADRSIVLVLVSEADGAVHLLDMGDSLPDGGGGGSDIA